MTAVANALSMLEWRGRGESMRIAQRIEIKGRGERQLRVRQIVATVPRSNSGAMAAIDLPDPARRIRPRLEAFATLVRGFAAKNSMPPTAGPA